MRNKQVYFGDIDDDLLEYANTIPNFSTWVKRQLQAEMLVGKREGVKRQVKPRKDIDR